MSGIAWIGLFVGGVLASFCAGCWFALRLLSVIEQERTTLSEGRAQVIELSRWQS